MQSSVDSCNFKGSSYDTRSMFVMFGKTAEGMFEGSDLLQLSTATNDDFHL